MLNLFLVHLTVFILSVSPAWAEDSLRLAGSTTVLPIASKAGERFMKLHPGVRVTVNSGGSGVGFQSMASGQVDIGLMSREIDAGEREKFKDAEFTVTVIGHDAVACVVSSEVYNAGVKALTRGQIRDIYLGKIRNWKEVGGPDRPIVAIDKERHRGTRHVFMEYVMGDAKAHAPGARLVTGSNNEEQAKIAQSDSAIGMLSHAWINSDVIGVAVIGDDGASAEPTLDNIRSGKYPIVRRLNLVTRGKPAGLVKEFIDYILGQEIQTLLSQEGYVPVR